MTQKIRFAVVGSSHATTLLEVLLARNLSAFLRSSDFEIGTYSTIPTRNEMLVRRLDMASSHKGAEQLIERAGAYALAALEEQSSIHAALKIESSGTALSLSSAVTGGPQSGVYWGGAYCVAGVLAMRMEKAQNQLKHPIMLEHVLLSQKHLGQSGVGPTQSADMVEVIVKGLVDVWRSTYERGGLQVKAA